MEVSLNFFDWTDERDRVEEAIDDEDESRDDINELWEVESFDPGTFPYYARAFRSAALKYNNNEYDKCADILSSIEEATRCDTQFNKEGMTVVITLLRNAQKAFALATGQQPSLSWETETLTFDKMSREERAMVLGMKTYFLNTERCLDIPISNECITEALRLAPRVPRYLYLKARVMTCERRKRRQMSLDGEIENYKAGMADEELWFAKVSLFYLYCIEYFRRTKRWPQNPDAIPIKKSATCVLQECIEDKRVMASPLLLHKMALIGNKTPALGFVDQAECFVRRALSMSKKHSIGLILAASEVLGAKDPHYVLEILNGYPKPPMFPIERHKLQLCTVIGKPFDFEEMRNKLIPLTTFNAFRLIKEFSVEYLVKKDLVKALEHYFEAINLAPSIFCLEAIRTPIFIRRVVLPELFLNEIMICLEEKRKVRYSVSPTERRFVMRSYAKIKSIFKMRDIRSYDFDLLPSLLHPLIKYEAENVKFYFF